MYIQTYIQTVMECAHRTCRILRTCTRAYIHTTRVHIFLLAYIYVLHKFTVYISFQKTFVLVFFLRVHIHSTQDTEAGVHQRTSFIRMIPLWETTTRAEDAQGTPTKSHISPQNTSVRKLFTYI